MNDFTNLEPYDTRVEDVVCRDCGKTFQINAQYDKNGIPVSFRSKYCPECNVKPKITGANGSWGTVNIESAKVPQRNVEGLEESLQTLATSIVNDRDEFKAFKKYAEHDIEENTKKIIENKIDVDAFRGLQAVFNMKQSELNMDIAEQFSILKKRINLLLFLTVSFFTLDLFIILLHCILH